MTKKEDFYINFSGFAHDHTTQEPSSGGGGRDQRPSQHHNGDQTPDAGAESNNQCSVIAILRRHPMYDSLVLVKKYRACLNGYSLEFPVDDDEDDNDEDEPDSCRGGEASLSTDSSEPQPHKTAAAAAAAAAGPLSKCSRRRLVSRLIDGDDPKFQHYLEGNAPASAAGQPAPAQLAPSAGGPLSRSASGADIIDPVHPFSQQSDDRGTDCQFVHVPLNGLLHRLKHFTESGLAVDSRVYSFAMGLKFAERILTTNSMKEVQETPI